MPARPVGRARAGLVAAAAVLVALAAVLVVLGLTGASDRTFRYDDPFDPFPPGGRGGTSTEVGDAPDRRELREFLPFVVHDVQGFWEHRFERAGLDYQPAQVVVFRGALPSACGPASPATGPFYCPADRRVYLELGFFAKLAVEFRAPGDFAEAYVIAHEIGHHVQNLTGVTAQVEQAVRERRGRPNELSIRLELQADCLAGVWGHSTYERGLLERGDLDEGLRAAAAVGDDRIQRMTTGRINPETWTHGSSEQRRAWFVRGFESGDPAACDTFSADV
jgi:uncharacterized protein